jgi:hypothetical protein
MSGFMVIPILVLYPGIPDRGINSMLVAIVVIPFFEQS